MTNPSLGRKKKKVTIPASEEGIEVAEKALIRLGFDSKANFAKSQLLARNTVTKFFQGEPIQLDSFKRICAALKLSWREIAGIIEEGQAKQLSTNSHSSSFINKVIEQFQLSHRRKVTVIDQQSKKIKAVITLEGDVDSVQNLQIIQSALKAYSGDTIAITDIKEGSIKLFVEGSLKDIKRLVSRIKSGKLKTVAGFPVEDVQILSESSDDESSESDEKWRLVQEIVSQRAKHQTRYSYGNLSDVDLSGADLSDVDLSGTNLIGADLSGADLSGADLSGTNLIGADLSGANLIGANLRSANLILADLRSANLRSANLRSANLRSANLRSANLRSADLSGADLFDANLSDAIVTNALFGDSIGLAEDIKRDLERRGAIFGDRPPVLNPK